MSSILDALNKLEQDRAYAQRSSEGVDVDPASAAQELIVPSVLRDRITIRFSPLTLILGGLASVIILVSFSVAAALLIVRSPEPDAAAVTDAAAQGTAVAARDAALGTTVTIVAPLVEPLPKEAPSSAVAAKTEASEPSALEVPEDQPNAAAALTASTEASKPAPAPETTPPAPEEGTSPVETHMAKAEVTTRIKDVTTAPGAAQRPGIVAPQERIADAPSSIPEIRSTIKRETVVPRAEPEYPALSLKELPILSKAEQSRYADEPFRINMIRPASDTNPYSVCVINGIRVYEGETIPGTRLQLLGVDSDGIGVTVRSSGQRYYINF